MKKGFFLILIVILTLSCSNDDDRPNCLELDTSSNFDPVIRSCEEIANDFDCTCD